jgi:predicted TIM-barrel enzyme
MMAGVETDLERVREVKTAVGDTIPVLANTGVRQDNVVQYLEVADGAIVGSAFKREGSTWNAVDDGRVERFMAVVREFRGGS